MANSNRTSLSPHEEKVLERKSAWTLRTTHAMLAVVIAVTLLPGISLITEMINPVETTHEALTLQTLAGEPVTKVAPGTTYKTHAVYEINRACRADFFTMLEFTTESAGTYQIASRSKGSAPLKPSGKFEVGRKLTVPPDAVIGSRVRKIIRADWYCFDGLPFTSVPYEYPPIDVVVGASK
jgi:hypothetical protein